MSLVIDQLATSVATRRGTLALGSAALLGITQARGTVAKKKSCKKKSRKKVDRTCGRQVEECTASYGQVCAGAPDPASCQAAYAPCCALLGECDFAGYQTCLSQLR